MSLTTSEVAARYGGSRPGFELVSAEEVGLPYFRLALELVVQERSELPTVDEFVLRTVLSGMDRIDDVAGVLGLERVLVEQAVVNQCHLDHLDYHLGSSSEERRLRVTTLGHSALQEASVVPERTEIEVGFDRLLWMPTGRRITQLIRARQATEYGLLEIPPRAKKRLSLVDLDTDSVERAIHELPVKALQETDVLALTNVTNHRYVLPAIALVYVADDASTTQVAFSIDGRLSDAHERAFAETGGAERCGFVVNAEPADVARPQLPPQLMAKALTREQVRTLQQQGAGLEQDLDDSRTATEALGGERASRPIQSSALAIKGAVEELSHKLNTAPVRAIQTYEHRELLARALSSSGTRLLIIAPWVRTAVVNGDFLARLERLCSNNVAVHIGWGFSSEEEAEQSDPPALESLRKLAGNYPNMQFKFIGDTHAKVLVWDDNMIVTSFNWLSFRGDPHRRYRQEVGVLIRDSAHVDEQYSAFRSQIEVAGVDELRH